MNYENRFGTLKWIGPEFMGYRLHDRIMTTIDAEGTWKTTKFYGRTYPALGAVPRRASRRGRKAAIYGALTKRGGIAP